MKLFSIPLRWKIGATLALAIGAAVACSAYRAHVYQAGYDAAVSERAAADALAALRRTESNTVEAARQGIINLKITETKHEELAPVVQRIYVDRVRVGAGTCGAAAATETEDAGSGGGANPTGRLVREDVERDTRALEEAVERHLATGRSCQAWGAENGFVP